MIGYQLAIQAARRPQATALVFEGRHTTYRQLDERVRRLAAAMTELGVGRGDRVASLLHNREACLEALFACALIGAVVVPVNFRLVSREVGQLLQACTPRLLLADPDLAELLTGLRGEPMFPPHVAWVGHLPGTPGSEADRLYEDWLASTAGEPPVFLPSHDTPVMLLHSSGTTGLPKGIVFTHGTVHASCTAKIIDFGLGPDDVTVVFGPLFHAGPLMDLVLPLLMRGGRVVIGASRHFDPQRLMRTVAEARGTAIPIYPTMLRRLVAEAPDPALDLSSLRLIVTGGESCPVPVIEGVHRMFPAVDFVNNYGSTEGGPVTTFLPPALSRQKMGSVGRESFGVEVRIADPEGRALGPGQVGEVQVRSAFVTPGYWNRPEATAAQRIDGWWRTGDLAWRDEDGCLWIAGRSKDMIKSGAENIFPIELEQVIAALPGVVEVGVIGVPDETWGESVTAYVVRESGAALESADVVAHCRRHLASYKKPRHVVFVDSLPRGMTGKVAKDVLRRMWNGSRG